MSETTDKAIDLVYPNLNCGCWSSPDPTDYPCKRCVESSEAIVVALEAHFREQFAKEADEQVKKHARANGPTEFWKSVARWLRKS